MTDKALSLARLCSKKKLWPTSVCLHDCLLLWSYSYGKGTRVLACAVFVADEKMLI